MENHEFDTVKAEKANAIANFRRVRNIAKLLRLLEIFVALALISYSSTRLPSAFKLCREYLIVFSGYLFNPHVVFVIGNVIVLTLYVLSRNVDGAESDSASAADIVSEDYHNCRTMDQNVAVAAAATDIVSEEYHNCSTTDHNAAAAFSPETEATNSENELSPPPTQSVTEERITEDRQMVCFENAVTKTESEEEAAAAAIETAKKQIRRFQRTRSEKLKREISTKKAQKDYRRSETEIRRLVVTSSNHGRRSLTSFETVDSLSNEEFRLKVEQFIEKQQSFLKSQKLAEDSK